MRAVEQAQSWHGNANVTKSSDPRLGKQVTVGAESLLMYDTVLHRRVTVDRNVTVGRDTWLGKNVTTDSEGADSPGPYGEGSGTSIAAPHVTGVVTLMLSANPALTPDDIRAILRATADDLDVPRSAQG